MRTAPSGGLPVKPVPDRAQEEAAGPARGRSGRPGAGDGGGRQAGALFAFMGVLGLVSELLPGALDRGHLLAVLLDAANLAIGVVVLRLPWSRLPRGSRLVLPVLAFTSVAANSAAGTVPIATTGIWYVLVFVWTGTWNSPRTVLAFSPVAVAAYLAPLALGAPRAGGAVSAVVLVVPVAVLVGLSIARQTASEGARRAAEDRLSTILEGAPIHMFACDRDGRVTFHQASPALANAALYPWQPPPDDPKGASAVGRSVFELLGDNPARLERVQRAMRGEEFTSEVQVEDQFVDVHYKPVYDDAGVLRGVTSVAFDITERVKAQRERQRLEVQVLAATRRQAYTDELTGLANRRSLYEHLDGLMSGASDWTRFAFLLLDLDRFKEVNDALGHTAGDLLLDQVGGRLGTLSGTQLVARLGGDEFALILAPGSGGAQALAAAEHVLGSFGPPFDLLDVSVHASVSIGIAQYPEHATSRSELMRCADVAMYRAKRSRHGFAVYDRGSDANHKSRLVTIEQLREAIGTSQLVCHFQPQVAVGSGRVVGAEALVRWHHPHRGMLVPGEFVPLAEQTGLISLLSRAVLDYALAECRKWHDAGHQLSVAVNIAVSDLLDTTLPATIAGLLGAHGLRPRALVLEITENAIMADPERVGSVVTQLEDFGIGFSVDDYGTGYTSLSYLRDLPLRELKLDRSFVTGMADNPADQAIVTATVSLARSLGLRLVAEGVETRSDWEKVRDLGVEVAQGYALSRPQCGRHFAEWLADWSPPARAGGRRALNDLVGRPGTVGTGTGPACTGAPP
ncbi:MAG: putative bifunctional diguanylate cyclase/phosphodiesterase, partial [Acidimicrobiales bacterium]